VDPVSPEYDALFLVLVGNFNPPIFQPAWLSRHGIVSEVEEEAAQIEIIRTEIASYTLGPFKFSVQPERFQVETHQPDQRFRLRDLVCNIFGLLPETPVTQLGINRAMHFSVADVDRWNHIGHSLVPKAVIWDQLMTKPGTMSVSVRGTRETSKSKWVQFRVEPSGLVNPGLFVQTTEHFDSTDSGAAWVPEKLTESWQDACEYSLQSAQEILIKVSGQ